MANWGLVLGFVGMFGGFLLAHLGLAAFAAVRALGRRLGGWYV